MAEPSDYERQRLANIENNRAMMRKLQLEAGIDMKPIKAPPPVKPRSHKRKTPIVKIEVEAQPRRLSSRLRGEKAPSEIAKRKAEEANDALQEAERAKRVRRSGDLFLTDAKVAGNSWNSGGFEDLNKWWTYKKSFTDADVKKTTDVDLKQMRERMNSLKLYEEFEPNQIKITPERIYCMAFNPIAVKPLVFAGDKIGNLGIFDASQTKAIKQEDAGDDEDEEDAEPAISSYKLHSRTITTLQFDPTNPNRVYSSSHDGTVRVLDLLSEQSSEVFAPAAGDEEALSCCEVAYDEANLLHVTTMGGSFARHDMREPSKTLKWYSLTDKKIGGFSLHPTRSYLLATASLDRTMSIWDLRKISTRAKDPPSLIGSHESRLSVSASNWNSSGAIATTSYDNTIKIYDFSKTVAEWTLGVTLSEEEMKPTHSVTHNNQTGRWVTILKPTWQQRPPDGKHKFCVGNMNRFVDIYSGDGQQLAQLGGDGITAVPAVAMFHPTNDWLAAGTASGKVCLWM